MVGLFGCVGICARGLALGKGGGWGGGKGTH